MLDDLWNGRCYCRADPFNEFTLAGWTDAQKNLQQSPDRLHVVPALASVDVHARWVVGVAVVGQDRQHVVDGATRQTHIQSIQNMRFRS